MYALVKYQNREHLQFLFTFKKWKELVFKYVSLSLRLWVIKNSSIGLNWFLKIKSRRTIKYFRQQLDKFNKDRNKENYYALRLTLDAVQEGLELTNKYVNKKADIKAIRRIYDTFSEANYKFKVLEIDMKTSIQHSTANDISSIFQVVDSDTIWTNRPKCYSFDF